MITISLNKRQTQRLQKLLEKGLAYDDMYYPSNVTSADDRLIKEINKQIKI